MKRRIFLLPIEPLEERYSADWLRWWPAGLRPMGDGMADASLEVVVVLGHQNTREIETGQFLDAVDTMRFKATQADAMLARVQAGQVGDDDIILMLDGWNPAVEMLHYARVLTGAKWKLAGLLHAGTWDSHDHLSRCGLEPSMRGAEQGWAKMFDRLYVATEFHKRLLAGAALDVSRTKVLPFPLLTGHLKLCHATPWSDRGNLVVFPHRLAPEKNPSMFEEMARAYRAKYPEDSAEFVCSKYAARTKADYYNLLGRARVAVSCAYQETWGIAMLESLALGAHPVAPARLSYPETMPADALYTSMNSAIELIHRGLHAQSPAHEPEILARYQRAFPAFINDLENL